MRTKGNCTLVEKDGRYVMTNENTGSSHDISSDPNITTPERLEAHWLGFLEVHLEGITLDELSKATLIEGVKNAKASALKTGGDFCDGSGQLVMHDKAGNRINGGPLYYFSGEPSVTLIRDIFKTHTKGVSLSVEGKTRYYGGGGAVRRVQEAKPCDWWVFNIYREKE